MTKRRVLGPLMCIVMLAASGCAALKPVVRTVNDIAVEACLAAFASAKPGVSLEDIAKQFCSTAEDLQPFVDSLLSAQKAAVARAK